MEDPEINRLIHEHIFDEEVVELKESTTMHTISGSMHIEPGWYRTGMQKPIGMRYYIGIRDYCNSWEAMGEVIEKIREHVPEIMFLPSGRVDCTLKFKDVSILADSAPKAVALAALKAKGVSHDSTS